MKKDVLLAILLIAALFISCHSRKQTTLNLTVNDSRDSVALVFIAGIVGPPDTLHIKIGEPASASYDLPEISGMDIRYNGRLVSFMAEPGKTYNITIDYSDTKNRLVSIDDPAAEAYNKLYAGRNIYRYEFVNDFSRAPLDTVAAKIKENFLDLINKDNALLDSVNMGAALHKAIEENTKLYWMTSLAKVIRCDYIKYLNNGTPMYPGYSELWDWVFENHPLREDNTNSFYFFDYAKEFFGRYYDSKHGEPDNPNYIVERVYAAIPEGDLRRELLTHFLYIEVLNNMKTYKKSITPYLERFIAEYPGSSLNGIFSIHMEEIEEYHRITAGSFPEGVKFVEGYDEITTLKDAIARFRGTPVFIDYWFTTCIPCLKQFQYNEGLKKFLDDNGIEMLYISIDPKEQEVNWQNAIKKYGLKGDHIRTSHPLHVDMDTNYGINEFPRYMVVDRYGEIVVGSAKLPEEGDKLYDQIKTALEADIK